MKDSEWVTDPEAIRTIALLKMLKAGDEVRLRRCEKYGIARPIDGEIALIAPPDLLVWKTENWPDPEERAEGTATPVALLESGYYIAYWNIAAWRRPLKEEK